MSFGRLVKKERKKYLTEHQVAQSSVQQLRRRRGRGRGRGRGDQRQQQQVQKKLPPSPSITDPEELRRFLDSLSTETKQKLGEKLKSFASRLPPNQTVCISLIPLNLFKTEDGITRQRYQLHLVAVR